MQQTPGSAIYYAIDFDASQSQVKRQVVPYFQGVLKSMALAGDGAPMYRVGVYGSGRVCSRIKQELKLADFSWLAESSGWAGSRQYKKDNLWDVVQELGGAGLSGLTADKGEGGEFEYSNGLDNIGSFELIPAVPLAATEAESSVLVESDHSAQTLILESRPMGEALLRVPDALRNLARRLEIASEQVRNGISVFESKSSPWNTVAIAQEKDRMHACAESLRLMLKEIAFEIIALESRAPNGIEVARELVSAACRCAHTESSTFSTQSQNLAEPEERRRRHAYETYARLAELEELLRS